MILTSGNSTIPLQGPSAVVIDQTGSFVFVVNHDSDNVAIFATSQHASTSSSSTTLDQGPPPPQSSPGGGAVSSAGSVKSVLALGWAAGWPRPKGRSVGN